jgi:hypothetical protein
MFLISVKKWFLRGGNKFHCPYAVVSLNGQADMHMVERLLECSVHCPRFHILTVTTLFWNKRLRTCCVFLTAHLGPLPNIRVRSNLHQGHWLPSRLPSLTKASSAAPRVHRAPEWSVLHASSSVAAVHERTSSPLLAHIRKSVMVLQQTHAIQRWLLMVTLGKIELQWLEQGAFPVSLSTSTDIKPHFSPDVSAKDIWNALLEQLILTALTCHRLKTKLKSYASFHVAVNEKDFPLINNTGTSPRSFLIGPFYGRLNLDQIYSPEDPVLTVAGAPVFSMNEAASTSPKRGDETDEGSS